MIELERYTPKGVKNIPSIRVSKEVFEIFKNTWQDYSYFTFSTEVWNNVRKGLHNKSEVYLFNQKDGGEANRYRLIANANKLVGRIHLIEDEVSDSAAIGLQNILAAIGDSHKDFELILDSSLKNEMVVKCRPQDAKRQLKNAVEKSMSQEDFKEFVDTIGLSEEEKIAKGIKPRHFDVSTNGKIIKFTDCVYQDIHKAHASFLLDTFASYPIVVDFVMKHLKAAKEAKAKDDLAEAKKHKDYINMAVGCLGQTYKDDDQFGHKKGEPIVWLYSTNTRPLYNKCVQVTRGKIDKQIAYLRKSIFETKELYSNTDGFILQHPDWSKVKESNEIGEFGTEVMQNNEVWFYSIQNSDSQTGYSIHQYYDEKGNKVIVGSLPDKLKEQVDLSKGIVVSYQAKRDPLGFYYYDKVTQIKVEMESK